MEFHIVDETSYFAFNNFRTLNIPHGIFTRHGGVSPVPWKSMNLGGNNGDQRENVIENRKRIFRALDRPVETLYDVWQVHSTRVLCVDTPRPLDAEPEKADAIITNRPEVTLFMRFADCVPVFVYDPCEKVIGMIHAGWQGTVQKITWRAIQKMVSVYGCQPQNIVAGIGPSICCKHYEVGEAVILQAKQNLPDDSTTCLVEMDGRIHFDLWQANSLQLQSCGVENIEIAGICTACHVEDWFSHRGEKGKTGRFGALLAL